MAFDWFGLFKPLLGPTIDKVLDLIPNKNERDRAKEELERKLMESIAAADNAQAEINKVEAQHKSLFVAGWRPFIGWVCGVGIAWSFVIEPFLTWAAVAFKVTELEVLPALDTGPLMSLVLAMLGIGGLRTFEKLKGVSRETTVFTKTPPP